ncbi:MAG: hypothetical protein R3B45_15795 [Bdellovibrionota bacterium]
MIWAALSDLEPQSKDNTEDNIAYALCQSAGNFGGNPGDCANGGVTPTDYDAICTQFASDGICYKDEFNNRILDQATTFDYYVYNTYSNGTGAFYDNFLQVGPFGYPYYTHGTITFVDAPDREDIRHFRPEEVHRQFLNFTYIKDLKKWTYIFYPVIAGQDNSGDGSLVLSEGVNSLTSEQIDGLLIIKQAIDNGALPVGDDLEVYGSTCTGFLALPQSVCSNIPGGEAALDSAVKAALAEKNVRVYCLSFVSACPGTALSLAGATSTAWLPAERIVRRLDSTPSNNLVTYYRPVYPATSDKVCQGEDVANAGKFQECAINKDKLVSDSDIRTQLNVPAAKLRAGNCDLLTFVDDFHACGDYYSYRFSKAFEQADEMIPFTYSSQFVPEALKRVDDHNSRPILAGMQAGEVLGFLARTHYQIYYVPTATASKINLLIGGLDESQGKYLLRVRMHDFSDPVDKR